jgi:hypothetical protein
LSQKESDLIPAADTKVHFNAATAFVRDARIVNHEKPIFLSGAHRGIRVTLDSGYILVEREWFSVKKRG